MRLILNIILFLGSLLCLIVAPSFHLWIASIAVSEFPWIFLLPSIGLLIWSLSTKKLRRVNTILSLLCVVIFLMPIVKAWQIGQRLPNDLAEKLGSRRLFDNTGNVFQFSKMFTNTELLPYETFGYAKAGDEDLTMDFYTSTTNGRRPCIIVIHGGSWCGGNSQQLPELNSELARQGFHVASINYRLAPKYISPAPIEDTQVALEYLIANADELKIDANNFILLGRSAGAQLALIAAYTSNRRCIRGVVNFYGPTDMVFGYEVPANPFVMDSRKVLEDFLGGPYQKVPQNYVSSSPVAVVSRTSVPTLIIHGMNDALVSHEHSERLVKKLAENNVPHYLLTLPWATHGCDYTLNGPSGQLTTYAVSYFAKQVLKSTDIDIQITSNSKEKSLGSEAFGSSGN